MKKVVIALLCICFLYQTTAFAKIVADPEFNDSVVFYFWDQWRHPAGSGTGGFWLTFIKHVEKTGVENYWLRADVFRNDNPKEFAVIVIDNKPFQLQYKDPVPGIYSRSGTNSRSIPSIAPVHAFYDLPANVVAAMSGAKTIAVIFDFQNRNGISLNLSQEDIVDMSALITLKLIDYKNYAREGSTK